MRIAIVTETFLPSTDGIVTRLCATIEWLREQGHEILIVAPALGVTEFKGAKVEGITPRSFFLYKHKLFAYPSRKVKRFLAEFKPDIVHVVNPAFVGLSGIYYSRRLRLPLIASYHTNIPQYADYYRLPFIKWLLWWYLRSMHNRADLNLCTSQAVKKDLDAHGFRNVKVWKRGVDTSRFQIGQMDPAMRDRLSGGRPDSTVLLFVGRLAAEKNIQSLRPLLDANPGLCLALVGDGPYRQALEEEFKGSRAVFCGFLHGDELTKAYGSSDLFVFPSTTETLGLVLLEAMAAGLPVVAARSEPTIEQIEHRVSGMLYDAEDPNGLQQAVAAMAEPEYRKSLGAQAAAFVRQLDWSEASKQLFGLYEELWQSKKEEPRSRRG